MLRLVYANRFESLVDALVEAIAAERATAGAMVWAQAPVIVPNLQVASYVKVTVARSTGIAAGMSFPFFESFLARHADRRAVRLADKGQLHALLCRLLADPALLADEVLAPVRAWLAAPTRDAADLRRFQLAGELATRFLDYAAARPELVGRWLEGTALDDTAWAEAERWQRRLYLEALGPASPWRTAPQLAGGVGGELALPPRLHLIGFSWLPPAYLRAVAALGARSELTVYALNPCAEFWEDVAGARGRRRAAAVARASSGSPDSDENGLLRLWGGPGRDHFRALNGLGDGDFVDRFVDPTAASPNAAPASDAPATPSLLAELQRDLLLRVGDAERAARPPRAADGSVQVLACPGVTRELEVIGEEIWSLLRADPTLRANDIAVLINRAELERYQPHVAAVFGALHELPHHLVEVPLAAESRIAEAVDLLLELPFGRFTRPELLRLLIHPAVLARYPHVDPADWVAWTDRLGIVHGADDGDHADTYVDGEHFHWRQGTRRLALGAFMAGPRSGLERVASFGNLEYLPEEVPRDALPSAALMSLLARSLIADARACLRAERTLAEWQRFLDRFVETYLTPAPGSEDDARSLRRCREAIAELADLDPDGGPVSYRLARELVRERLAALRGDSGELFARGVVVAPVLPMRPIPFRHVFVAGLGEGLFPATDGAGPLDLRAAAPAPGDVGPRERDRYAFLEIVLAARERLYLSYVARDEQSGEALEPSSVVVELAGALAPRVRGGADALVRSHALRRWEDEHARHAPAALRQRRAAALRRDLERHLAAAGVAAPEGDALRRALAAIGGAPAIDAVRAAVALHGDAELPPRPPHAAAVTVSLSTLRAFLEAPIQAWARHVLRLRDVEDEDPVAREDEPLTLDVLESTSLLRDVFLRWLAAPRRPVEAIYRERFDLLRRMSAAPIGVFGALQERLHLATLRSWQGQLEQSGVATGPVAPIGFGRGDRGAAARIQPPLLLELDLGGERLRVELVGSTQPLVHGASLRSLVLVAGGGWKLKHALRGALDQMVLAAAGIAADVPHATLVLTPDASRAHAHQPWSQADASAHLRLLVADLLTGSHDYLLPIEAIAAWQAKRDPAQIPRRVEKMRGEVRNGAWARPEGYGPISGASGLDAPDDGAALADRRFSPLLERTGELDGAEDEDEHE